MTARYETAQWVTAVAGGMGIMATFAIGAWGISREHRRIKHPYGVQGVYK
jgi:hypothetical protein